MSARLPEHNDPESVEPLAESQTGQHAAPTAETTAVLTEPLRDSFEDEASARARARDRAVVGSSVMAVILQVVLAILAPLVVLVGVVRLVASPVFLWLEYHRAGFPADQFGMTTEQRLNYGSYGLDYLFNVAPQSYLGELTFANGNPVFTQAEVGHMADVKQVMMITTISGVLAMLVCIILMVLLYRMRKGAIGRAFFFGAVWLTTAMLIVAIMAAFGWETFFAAFHQIFFAEGTWTFYASDTLIRLYPGQFWIDAAIWIAGLTLVVMVVTMLCTAPTRRRRYRNAQAQRLMESQVMGGTQQLDG